MQMYLLEDPSDNLKEVAMQTTQMVSDFPQIQLPKPNPCCVAWSKRQEVLDLTWTHIRQNWCILNQMESSLVDVVSLWN